MANTTGSYAVADYLMDRLAKLGCKKLFGVPGITASVCWITLSPIRRSIGSAAVPPPSTG